MDAIKSRLEELEALVKEHPRVLPVGEVAKFLGVNREGLMAALMRQNAPFGFAYQKGDGSYRVPVIPTAKFYLWYTNQTGLDVMAIERGASLHADKDADAFIGAR